MTTYEKLMRDGEQIGLQKGEQIGLEKGEQKTKTEILKNCFKEGVSPQLASKISGLSLEEVSKIYSEMTGKD